MCFLFCKIQEMMRENEILPDIERLEQREFNLDVEEQGRLEAMVEQEVVRVNHTQTWAVILLCGHDYRDS